MKDARRVNGKLVSIRHFPNGKTGATFQKFQQWDDPRISFVHGKQPLVWLLNIKVKNSKLIIIISNISMAQINKWI